MERAENKEMPSQIQGYPDTTTTGSAGGNMPSYSWTSQQQQQQQGTNSNPMQQGAAFYGVYTGAPAPAASYESSHQQQSYPQRPTADSNQGGTETSQSDDARQVSIQNYSNGVNPDAPSSQETAGTTSSPTSGATNNTSSAAMNTVQSQSTENVATATENQTAPPTMPPTYGQVMPYTFFVNQGFPQYAWTPYGPAGPYPPPPPQPHARRSLEYSTHHAQQEASTKSKKNADKGKIERVRAMSPSQLESTRRDEVANMGCTCKKSKCLKLYCMCFGASVVCGPNCRCLVCFNTPDHEAERKEAIRVILSRNPSAFDTKFKKTGGGSPVANGGSAEAGEATSDKVLSHKIGCKCRKSQCTKKYCECFHAGVKCSPQCRCTGCQNMPPGGFGPDPRYGYPMLTSTAPYAAAAMMPSGTNLAAEKLAFLKNSSPNKPEDQQPVATPISDATAVASMPPADTTPSLATESSPQSAAFKSSEGGVANALLMAAYAMTELHADESPLKPAPATDASGTTMRASPKRKSHEYSRDFTNGDDIGGSSNYDSPPKPFPNVETQLDDDRREGDESLATATKTPPTNQRRSKRSRLGTHKKLPLARKAAANKSLRNMGTGDDDEEQPENKSPGEIESTPVTRSRRSSKKSSPNDSLTPVSARCIDFRRMDVKGKRDEE